jgi:sigma-B regulation protein RsbU (phosphoserine phosphatase)
VNVQTDPTELRQEGQSLVRLVLLVDDSRLQRRILRASLERWGYAVLECGSGEEALEICRQEPVDLIISDWMMPGMKGPEFCRAFRALPRDSYGYFILLTSKSETGEMVHGLDLGADEFLTKPVNASELRARIASGERILSMESELREKNRLVSSTLAELRSVYDALDRDLIQARKIQQSLMPEREMRFGRSRISTLIKPCGHVGGDLVGMFCPGEGRLGFYNIDVSGHGVTSALMTARLASYLSGRFLDQNIALEKRFEKYFALRPPEEVAHILNERLLSDRGVEEYFTMAYGTVDLLCGHVRMVQAGHPYPLLQRANGEIEMIGTGGMPLGLLEDAQCPQFELDLEPGDRLLLYSDGFTEAFCEGGEMLEEAGLADLLREAGPRSGPALLDEMHRRLCERQGGAVADDDVSAVLLEYDGF